MKLNIKQSGVYPTIIIKSEYNVYTKLIIKHALLTMMVY